jgi:predicted O-linked N-acetylglucosamine transferase (SPINDLY family)
LIGRLDIEAYFKCYGDVDMAFDSFPYNGATTTCDALIMGVPVATVAGNRAIARGGVSLLSTIGMAEWIGRTPEDLIDVLRTQTADVARMAAIRDALPHTMRASALMDGARFARNVEALYSKSLKKTNHENFDPADP